MTRVSPLIVALIGLFLTAFAVAEPPDFSEAALQSKAAELHQALVTSSGVEFELPRVRVVEKGELSEILKGELLVNKELRFPEGDHDERAEKLARLLSLAVMGKYVFERGEVVLVPANFEELAEFFDEPRINSQPFVDGILLHELIHAMDDQRYRAGERLRACETLEQITMLDVALEGHAQYLTRKTLTHQGKSELFGLLEKVMTAPPPTDDPGQRYVQNLRLAPIRFSYVDGRRFFEGLEELRPGVDLGDLVFASPPKTKEEVIYPERYGSQVEVAPAADLEPLWRKLRREDSWTEHRGKMEHGAVQSAFQGILEEDQVRPVLAGFVRGYSFNQIQSGAEQKLLLTAIFECKDEQAAVDFARLNVELVKAKDAKMAGGLIQILESQYEELERPSGPKMTMARKKMKVGNLETAGFDATLPVGRFVVELVSVGADLEEVGFESWLETVVDFLEAL